ncbi:MAG: LysR family transcriptional regulator [Lachnospiraceae bacterium]|nr:LysR family transcriptional regulator [Lachnospiraceae bacterium]
MTLNQLRYFQTLARTEHYSQAADILYISQPSLSKAISQLESELGVALFEKNGRNVRLSSAGKTFQPYVDQALDTIEKGVQQLRCAPGEEESLSIGCICPALIPYLAPMLRAYQDAIQKKQFFQTQVDTSENLIKDLLAGKHDVVFCTRIANAKKVRFTLVCDFPFYVAVRKDSTLAQRAKVYPEELDGYPMLFTSSIAYTAMIREMMGYYHINPTTAGVSNDESGLLGMVEAGLGIFISTDYPQIHSENTVLIPLAQTQFRRAIHMAVRDGQHPAPGVQSLIHFAQTFRPDE